MKNSEIEQQQSGFERGFYGLPFDSELCKKSPFEILVIMQDFAPGSIQYMYLEYALKEKMQNYYAKHVYKSALISSEIGRASCRERV